MKILPISMELAKEQGSSFLLNFIIYTLKQARLEFVTVML